MKKDWYWDWGRAVVIFLVGGLMLYKVVLMHGGW